MTITTVETCLLMNKHNIKVYIKQALDRNGRINILRRFYDMYMHEDTKLTTDLFNFFVYQDESNLYSMEFDKHISMLIDRSSHFILIEDIIKPYPHTVEDPCDGSLHGIHIPSCKECTTYIPKPNRVRCQGVCHTNEQCKRFVPNTVKNHYSPYCNTHKGQHNPFQLNHSLPPTLWNLTSSFDMGHSVFDPMITEWVVQANDEIRLPISYNDVTIDWGDNSPLVYHGQGQRHTIVRHTFNAAGVYIITIWGKIPFFDFNKSRNCNASAANLVRIHKFGSACLGASYMSTGYFKGCTRLQSIDRPTDIRLIKSADNMFSGCISFNQRDIGSWNMESCITMDNMFYGAKSFDGSDIGNWYNSTKCVQSMKSMFDGATKFNPKDIGNWNVSKVTNMERMFNGAQSFVGTNIGKWNVSKVTNMSGMFSSTKSFNPNNIGNWNVSSVQDMSQMFQYSNSFVGNDIGNWGDAVKKVQNMKGMFEYATMFNPTNIGKWNVESVKYMSYMFKNATSFVGSDIGEWKDGIRNVQYTFGMFTNAESFHPQNIKTWIIEPKSTDGMFLEYNNFEQLIRPFIDGWNLSEYEHEHIR